MTTKTAQFTPGPWVVKSTDEDINTKTIVDGNEFWIARVLNFNRASDDIRESQANANLIAAAPAMYEALVRFAKAIKAECYDEDILVDIYHDVRDALAQAEGRQA